MGNTVHRLATVVAALTWVACGGESSTVPSDANITHEDAAVSDSARPEEHSTGCSAPALPAGDTRVSITFAGLERTYLVHVPPSADNRNLPLVLAFHGLASTDQGFADRIALSAKADAAGFVAAYPNGFDKSWNAGGCCPGATDQNVDDVGFARAVVDDIGKKLCVNPKRVYATGFSNGGMMTHRLACEAADIFAAIVSVSGQLHIPPESCRPSRAIPVMHIHGTADEVVPYEGRTDRPSVPTMMAGWATRNGCTDTAPSTTFKNGIVECLTHSMCKADAKVTLCTIVGGGHCWPGFGGECSFGLRTSDIVANDALWEFFSAFSLP